MMEMSVHVQYGHNLHRLSYVVHVSSNVTYFPKSFGPPLVESSEVEPWIREADCVSQPCFACGFM